tara:strand:+ start:1508 stop:1888 length:381 start_codon:yes stop_codon:yes gene_type:complete
MMKNVIKKILKEETNRIGFNGTDVYETQDEIALGLSYKAMQHLIDALRDIESALENVDDKNMEKVLNSIRMSLLSDGGRQEGFAAEHDTEYDNIINVLGDMIDGKKQDNVNFNLNGPGPKAPEGVA